MKRVAPGLYVGPEDGTLHIDAEEFLVARGVPPTPENIDRLIAAAATLVPTEVVEHDDLKHLDEL